MSDQANPGSPQAGELTAVQPETLGTRDLLLIDLARRMQDLQSAVQKQSAAKDGNWRSGLFDLMKTALTGWPTFAILFLVLFYAPIRDALISIPEKVRSAEEIQMAGVSLKGAVKLEAARVGEVQLSEKLPKLTSSALEYLLALPQNGDPLWTFAPDPQQQNYAAVWMLNDDILERMAELDALGLVTIQIDDKPENGEYNWKKISAGEAKKFLRNVPTKFPGKASDHAPTGRIGHLPDQPIPRKELATIRCHLSDLGIRAKEVIIKAVGKQLSGTNADKAK